MPFFGQTLVVSDALTYVAADQVTAIHLAATNASGNKATVIPRFPIWPSMTNYVNDNGPFANILPAYIWGATTTDNQTLGFAARSSGIGGGTDPIFLAVNLTVFADNAHYPRIDVYDISDVDAVLVETITPLNLTDGSLDPNTGLVETIPYNWQDIRYFNTVAGPYQGQGIYAILVSFTAVNYLGLAPPVTPNNPAGVMFYAIASYFT